jgi:VIT1/CCC1 family predicted Fe2+/Mn2+ transporter
MMSRHCLLTFDNGNGVAEELSDIIGVYVSSEKLASLSLGEFGERRVNRKISCRTSAGMREMGGLDLAGRM